MEEEQQVGPTGVEAPSDSSVPPAPEPSVDSTSGDAEATAVATAIVSTVPPAPPLPGALALAQQMGKKRKTASLTAEEALRQAEAEGLELPRGKTTGGYSGVQHYKQRKSKPFVSSIWQGAKLHYLGSFNTAEEAALVHARAKRDKLFAEPLVLSAEEALAAAEAEGLVLERSSQTDTGYAGITNCRVHKARPFEATLWDYNHDREKSLGHFATAEVAALERARAKRGKHATHVAAGSVVATSGEDMQARAAEAQRLAESEGLTLERSDSASGFVGVTQRSALKLNPYEAHIRYGGRLTSLGYFATPEEAARAYALAKKKKRDDEDLAKADTRATATGAGSSDALALPPQAVLHAMPALPVLPVATSAPAAPMVSAVPSTTPVPVPVVVALNEPPPEVVAAPTTAPPT